jgi:hypothetical protein
VDRRRAERPAQSPLKMFQTLPDEGVVSAVRAHADGMTRQSGGATGWPKCTDARDRYCWK